MAILLRKRHLAAAVTGNALEFYDFTTYAYFATQIGQSFFPFHDHFMNLMASLITFGVGFVARPIGAVVIGRYADKVGRKPAMLLSFILMGAGLIGVALTPSYATIGIAAPVIVVLLRLVQGFALGGDVGPTTSFLLEAAPPNRRGLYGSLQFASQGLSTLAAGLVGFVLASFLEPGQLVDFGWRIAFLLGAVILPIGFIIRRTLPETLHDEAPADMQSRAEPRIWRSAILGLIMIMGSTTGFYVLAYMSTYAQTVLNMKTNVAFAATIVFGLCNIIFSLIAGGLSDRIGRKTLMLWPRVLLLLAAYPAFLLITQNRTALTLLAATAILAIFTQSGGAVSLVALTEAMPRQRRSAVMATVYAVGVATFGGTTQPIVVELIHKTGDIFAPAWWMIGTTFICLIATALMDETAPIKIGRTEF